MSVVISSYHTGRPSKVDVATAIETLPFSERVVSHLRMTAAQMWLERKKIYLGRMPRRSLTFAV
jgi:hypothetical protein